MKAPSRTMPPYKRPPMSIGGWVCFVVLGMGAVVLSWLHPLWLLVIPAFAMLTWDASRKNKLRLSRFREERADESICTFARSFDTKIVDTWIVRAVYEEVQSCMGDDVHQVPIRADDKLIDDLNLDSDDIDLDLLDQVAQRSGRSLENYEKNPMYGKVHTAQDLVFFFREQPMEARPEAR